MNKIIIIKEIKRTSPTKIEAKIILDSVIETITSSFSENVADFVVIDRCDAYVVGLLNFAITNGYDFLSDIPISAELYYNLNNHFLDALHDEETNMHRPMLNIPTSPESKKIANVVATGISCGIDSLYTIATHSKDIPERYKITHLAFFDVGSHGDKNDPHTKELFNGRLELCKGFAKEYGYEFFTVSSNIHQVISKFGGYSHISNHTYMTAFCVLLLQAGIGTYYYSAGHPYKDFRCYKLRKNEDFDSSHYDLLSSLTFSINGLKFYSSGGSISRIEKTKFLCQYEPAYKYLNVCVNTANNDGQCFKCKRTMLGIDATGDIKKFKDVFDVDSYLQHRTEYMYEMYVKAKLKNDELLGEIIPYFGQEISWKFKIEAIFYYAKRLITNL